MIYQIISNPYKPLTNLTASEYIKYLVQQVCHPRRRLISDINLRYCENSKLFFE